MKVEIDASSSASTVCLQKLVTKPRNMCRVFLTARWHLRGSTNAHVLLKLAIPSGVLCWGTAFLVTMLKGIVGDDGYARFNCCLIEAQGVLA